MTFDVNRPVILAVDDDPTTISTIVSQLKKLDPKFLIANRGQQALDVLKKTKADIIVLDINMPEMSGLEVCKQIKNDPTLRHIPVLFLTGSQTDIGAAFDAGGVDYILKPVKSDELIARVKTHLKLNKLMRSLDEANALLESVNESLEDKVQKRTLELVTANKNLRREIDERRRLQDKLSYLSNYDFITRMFNRNSMEDELRSKLEQLHISREKWFLYFIDMDQFKIINDTCGHVAGDELLRELADLIKGFQVDEIVCARMGGDEFAVLLTAKDLDSAIQKGSQLKMLIENYRFEWEDEVFKHSISMALVELDESVDSASHLLSIAERTCYESKRKGGGEISVYNHSREYIDKSQQQMKIIPIIHHALENNLFMLYFQRIIALKPENSQKVELLLRLKDLNGRVIPPGHFIPIAERYHLISAIEKWVINASLKAMTTLPEELLVSINLSGEFIIKSGAFEIISEGLKHYKINPKRVCFEITETSALSNLTATQELIEKTSALGCQFSLDDFGTGTSSYEYLRQLRVDYVKIDGMFVRDIETDPINRKMVESIVGIAKAKNVKVVAECVENEEALVILQALGIDYYQGFVSHRPEPLEDYTALKL